MTIPKKLITEVIHGDLKDQDLSPKATTAMEKGRKRRQDIIKQPVFGGEGHTLKDKGSPPKYPRDAAENRQIGAEKMEIFDNVDFILRMRVLHLLMIITMERLSRHLLRCDEKK